MGPSPPKSSTLTTRPLHLSRHSFDYFNVFIQGEVDCVQALLEGNVDVNLPGNSGLTALHIACMCGHHEV